MCRARLTDRGSAKWREISLMADSWGDSRDVGSMVGSRSFPRQTCIRIWSRLRERRVMARTTEA